MTTVIKTLDNLRKLKEKTSKTLDVHEKGVTTGSLVQVKVAMATCGIASGAKQIMEYMMDELDKRNIRSVVKQTGCMGYCYAEPTIEVKLPNSEPLIFGNVDIAKADEIIERYIKKGELVDGIIPVTYKTID